jgi:hypothetical protein
MLSVAIYDCYDECHYAEMLNVVGSPGLGGGGLLSTFLFPFEAEVYNELLNAFSSKRFRHFFQSSTADLVGHENGEPSTSNEAEDKAISFLGALKIPVRPLPWNPF